MRTPLGGPVRWLSLDTNALWVDPVNPDNLLVAGVRIYSSTNGGLNLSGNGPPPVQKAEQRNDAEYKGKTPAALSHTVLP